MQKRHIDANIDKTIALATGLGVSGDLSARHAVASSCQTANKLLGSFPHFTKIKLYSSQYSVSSDCCFGFFAPARPPFRTEGLVAGYFCCRKFYIFLGPVGAIS